MVGGVAEGSEYERRLHTKSSRKVPVGGLGSGVEWLGLLKPNSSDQFRPNSK